MTGPYSLQMLYCLPMSAALAPVGPRIKSRGKYGPALLNNASAQCAHVLMVLLLPTPELKRLMKLFQIKFIIRNYLLHTCSTMDN